MRNKPFKAANAVGQRLKQFREAAQFSQPDVANRTDISQPTYSRVECGDRALRGDEAIQLAAVFGVRLGAILGRPEIAGRVEWSCRNAGGSDMAGLREALDDYMELDTYLRLAGVE